MPGTPTLRLFLMAWIGSMVLLVGVWREWADWPAIEAEQGALIVQGVMMVVAPWLAGPGLLPLLRRRSSGGVNLPYAEYWFTGQRRASSLDRLRPYMDLMGAMMSVFLSAVLLIFVGERVDAAVASVSALMFLTAVVALLGGSVLWVRALLRAFPAPEPSTGGPLAVRTARRPTAPRRPSRPGPSGRPRDRS